VPLIPPDYQFKVLYFAKMIFSKMKIKIYNDDTVVWRKGTGVEVSPS